MRAERVGVGREVGARERRAFSVVLAAIGVTVALGAVAVVFAPLSGVWWKQAGYRALTITAFLVAIVASFRRARLVPAQAWAWRLQGVALALYLVGNLYATFGTGSGPPPLPSLADALWLSFYLLTYASILLHARARCRTRPARVWLDGLIAGLAISAVASAVVFGPLLTLGHGSAAAVTVGLAYPVADLVLLLLMVCVLHAAPKATWASHLQIAGLAALLVGDVAFLLGQAHGTWDYTSPYRLGWMAAVTLLGLSALAPVPTERSAPTAPQLVLPMSATAVTFGLLIYGQRHDLAPVAIALAAATVLLALIRVALTVEEIRRLTRSQHQARFDAVTGLPNRRELLDRLVATDPLPPGLSILLLRLVELRDIEHSVGYESANQAITATAARLDGLLEPGWWAARVAEDEFAVVATATSAADTLGVASRIREDLRRPIEVAGLSLALSTNIGIAAAPEHGATGAELLTSAGLALRQAKTSSGHVAAFRPDPSHPTRSRLVLRTEIADALGSGQFVAHFQPQIDLVSGVPAGVEALVRWEHPTRGLVAPVEFLHLVAEGRMMPLLTALMIDHAAAGLAACSGAGHPIGLSVNISALDLVDDRLVERLDQALLAIEGTGGQLTVEITEDAVMIDRDRAAEVLALIRARGARVSVDDYGTGQASLSYLRDLPLDELKLDRSFIDRSADDPRRSIIVQSTVELAHQLGLTTVAEGIEDDATATWLQTIGCDIGQGYHFARPMPLERLIPWLDDRSTTASPPTSSSGPRRSA